jgi:hypothetical protein
MSHRPLLARWVSQDWHRCPLRLSEAGRDSPAPHDFHFDIFQFPFRFNPGTNGGNVEMGLINKSFLVTLNQRVPGSSPGAPTKYIKRLAAISVYLS